MGSYYPSDAAQKEMVQDAKSLQMTDEEALSLVMDCGDSFGRVLMGGGGVGHPSRSRWELAAELDEAIRIVKRSIKRAA